MLRRLRKQMVLLNAAISGAILLAMALVALHVSENVLVSQYEQDLERNATQMLHTMLTVPKGVQVQFASDYMVYHADGKQVRIIGGEQVQADALTMIVNQASETVAAEHGLQANVYYTTKATGLNILQQRFFVAENEAVPESGWDAAVAEDAGMDAEPAVLSEGLALYEVGVYQGIADGLPEVGAVDENQPANVLMLRQEALPSAYHEKVFFTANGIQYRGELPVVSAQGDKVEVLMVLQDRTAELQARDGLRWLFFGCALGGLVLIGAASLYLSARSIRPVEQSIRRQREFVAAASHELRTPVAAVRANAEVLADAALGEYAPYLSAIEEEGQRMTHLVTDLMDLARADADGLAVREEPVELDEVARHTVEVMRSLAEQRGLSLSAQTKPVLVKADADRMRQALVALVDNALRYTQKGGAVLVEVERSGSHAYMRVIDNGPGIPAEHKPRVFDRFYRVSPARSADGGCGLGLSVAQQLVGRMAGTIKLHDAPDGGCIFEMRFRILKV